MRMKAGVERKKIDDSAQGCTFCPRPTRRRRRRRGFDEPSSSVSSSNGSPSIRSSSTLKRSVMISMLLSTVLCQSMSGARSTVGGLLRRMVERGRSVREGTGR